MLITNSDRKFGDVGEQTKIYYLDPFVRKVEPAFVIGRRIYDGKPNLITLDLLLIPEEYRNQPLTQLPLGACRKIIVALPKIETLCLVPTKPPTLYSTTSQELDQWLKNKKA